MKNFEVRSLRVRYPAQAHWAIDDLSCDIESGAVTWLTGALGSGTSTLLLALAGLIPRIVGGVREGSVTIDGNDVALVSPLAAGIAYLGPSPALQISGIAESVRGEIAVGPASLGLARDSITSAVESALHSLRLAALAGRAPATLSGGETQRMIIASLLASAPNTWLLDEPFSALDRAGVRDVKHLIRAEAATGKCVIVACDDADIMHDVADRMIVMQHGHIVLDGQPAVLLAGDALRATGAGTTDAATLAIDAGFPAPRPITRESLLQHSVVRRDVAHVAPAPSPQSADVVLAMESVRFGYDKTRPVINDITLDIRRGDAVGVFGANGAGKSTLLRLGMALEHPTAGSVTTLGKSTRTLHPEDFAPNVGFLFQQPERQLFASSVRGECAIAARLAGWDSSRIDDAVRTVLEELGLSDTSEEHPYDLPLPRRRLVALAAVLVADPDLLLLDEPTAALDFASRELVIRVIRKRTARGKAVVAVTHDAVFAHEALDRAILLEGGARVFDGSPRSVIDDVRLEQPAALAVAIALGLPAGADRRAEVAGAIRSR